MKKEIKIWDRRLEISKETHSHFYMINNSKLDLFIHIDKLELRQSNDKKGWLAMFNDSTYIGSMWIDTDTDMKKVEKFLEETKCKDKRK